MPKMTLSEALAEGLQVTGVGLIIVFSVLIILMLVMMAMKVIFYKEDKPQKKSEPKAKAPENKPAPAPVQAKTDDSELIAVLTAAVAACMDVPVSSLNIKSYKKVSAWNKASVRDIIDSRF